MVSTPDDFLQIVVRPNLQEFVQAPGDIRRAINAILAVDALSAYIFHALPLERAFGANEDSSFRAKLSERCPAFSTVRDAAKALKHVRLTRGSPQIRSAEAVHTKEIGYGEAYGLSWGGGSQVAIMKDGEVHIYVSTALREALNYLVQEFNDLFQGMPSK